MTKHIKVGVAGAGVFGGYHASKYADHPQAQLLGVFDVNAEQAATLANRFGVRAYHDFHALLEECDAVVITAPASVHFELAEQALSNGRHVFVEKPITLRPEEADALIELSEKHQRVLQVGHQERYVFDAVGLFSRKRKPLSIISARMTGAHGRCGDTSATLDLMVHDLDLVRMLTGADLKTVSAEGDWNEASAELSLTNGTVASLKASRQSDRPERRMTLVYDDGVVEFDFLNREVQNTTSGALETDFSDASPPVAFTDPLMHGANKFIESIQDGTAPVVSALDGREALRWARRIEEAAGISAEDEHSIPTRRTA